MAYANTLQHGVVSIYMCAGHWALHLHETGDKTVRFCWPATFLGQPSYSQPDCAYAAAKLLALLSVLPTV